MRVEIPPPPAPPAISKASGVGAIRDGDVWITTDDYVVAALRAQDEGTTAVIVGASANGHISPCSVTVSSGSSTLNAATC